MQQLFTDEIAQETVYIKIKSETIATLIRVQTWFDGLDLSDFAAVGVNVWQQEVSVYFSLKTDKQASHIPHKLAQHFGIDLIKEASPHCVGLSYEGVKADVEPGWTLHIIITGAVPETCHIEETEEALPEDQWVKSRMVRKIVCAGSE